MTVCLFHICIYVNSTLTVLNVNFGRVRSEFGHPKDPDEIFPYTPHNMEYWLLGNGKLYMEVSNQRTDRGLLANFCVDKYFDNFLFS
jgi:hypothetical protein